MSTPSNTQSSGSRPANASTIANISGRPLIVPVTHHESAITIADEKMVDRVYALSAGRNVDPSALVLLARTLA